MQGKRRLLRTIVVAVAALVAGGLVVLAVVQTRLPRVEGLEQFLDQPDEVSISDADVPLRVAAFCGDCHAVPKAESFPRGAWDEEVNKGYQYYARSGRTDLEPPPIHLTKAYFRSLAPKRLNLDEGVQEVSARRQGFKTEEFFLAERSDLPPGVANLRWIRLEEDQTPVLIVCDMRTGSVTALDLGDRQSPPTLLARLNNPCHVEPCDLDQDGRIDLLVADLGSFYPHDHERGRVVWLRREGEQRSFEQIVLASGLGRVADVRPADFDADGQLDFIVAEFGHYRTGGIHLYRNVTASGERPRFQPEKLDHRPGTIHVPVLDLDHDGRPDFLALVSQEYECVDAFFRQGEPTFRRQTLWAAPDLAFGSSGIEPVDLDGDGDLDVLYSNGDAFDNSCLNASHGVQWLENQGELRFACHRLADLPGAYRALAGDLDRDGDQDVIVVAWLPSQLRTPAVSTSEFTSILYLEQTLPKQFVRHTLEHGNPYHATLELADFDGDGDLDFAVGSLLVTIRSKNTRGVSSGITVWWNEAEPPVAGQP